MTHETCRGRAAKALRNRSAYVQRNGFYPSPFAQNLIGVPSVLIDYARRPFRVSTETEKGDGLALWDPPYCLQHVLNNTGAFNGMAPFTVPEDSTTTLTLRFHAVEFRLFVEAGISRYEHWANSDKGRYRDWIANKIEMRLAVWMDEHRTSRPMLSDAQRAVKTVWLE